MKLPQAVERYRDATERNDIDALMPTFAPDVELISPLSGRMVFRGAEDIRLLATAVYSTLSDLRWSESSGSGPHRALLVGTAKVGPLRLGDVTLLELRDDGLIQVIRPYLRPWLATTLFALILGTRLARRPSVLWRALKRGKR